MDSNTELIINSVKSNLSGNLQNDIVYIDRIIGKYSDNQELLIKLELMKSFLESNGYDEFGISAPTEEDTSIDDGVIQEKKKKKSTKADRQIRDIKVLFKQSTADSELKLVYYELPKLQSLYERTTLVSEKETICAFANYNYNGLTPLHLACYYEEFELVKFFISIGADVNAVFGIYGVTPLDHLLYNNKNETGNDENRRQIEMFLINNGAKRGFTLKRNLGLILLTTAAAFAFLVSGIFSPLFLVPSAVFIVLTILLIKDCQAYKAKKKKTAVLLAVFGGGIGLHKFYLNNLPAAFWHIIISILTLFIGGIIMGFFDISKIKNDKLLDAGSLKLKN